MVWLLIILATLIFLFSLGGFLARYAVGGPRYTPEETFQNQCGQNPEVGGLKDAEKTAYEIEGYRGYTLHAVMYSAPSDDTAPEGYSKKFLIMVHGYTLNRNGELKYMPMYRRLGYNCIVYDHRGHGENRRFPCTFGLYEAKDLMKVIEDTYRRYGKDIYLGLTGESLGAATEITALRYHPDVRFIVNDCGYADLIPVEKDGLKGMHLPQWLVYLADLSCRIIYHFSFTGRRPIDSLKDNKIPICFIHGDADKFIRCEHSVRMDKATAGYHELHLIPGAEHAKSINTDPEGYEKIVDNFVRGVETGRIR